MDTTWLPPAGSFDQYQRYAKVPLHVFMAGPIPNLRQECLHLPSGSCLSPAVPVGLSSLRFCKDMGHATRNTTTGCSCPLQAGLRMKPQTPHNFTPDSAALSSLPRESSACLREEHPLSPAAILSRELNAPEVTASLGTVTTHISPTSSRGGSHRLPP